MTHDTTNVPKFGYRDEEFGGSGEHDPKTVCTYELAELGNVDVPMTILRRYADRLTTDEARLLHHVVHHPTTISEPTGTAVVEAYTRIIDKVCDGRDFCLWLCRTPRDYFDAYVDVFDDDTEMRRERIASVRMSRYAVPEDAIVLSDDPMEGLLLAWRSDATNTTPVDDDIDFEMCLSPLEREPDCFPGTTIPMSRDTVRVTEFDRFGHLVAQPEFAVHMGDEDDLRDWTKLSIRELLDQIRQTAMFAAGHTFLVDDNRLSEPLIVSTDTDERTDMERDETELVHTSVHSKENDYANLITTQPDDSQCPFCGGLIDDADTAEMTRHSDRAYAEQVCRCPECDTEWVDQYVWRRAVRM